MLQNVARALERFEEMLTALVEGSLSRALHTRLQPVELAKRLAAAMEAAPRRGPQNAIAPNRYTLHLNPDDWAVFEAILPSLEAELARYAVQAASERDLLFCAPPQVSVAADPAVPVHGVRVQTEFSEPCGVAAAGVDTQRIPPVAPAAWRGARPPSPHVPTLSAVPGSTGPGRVELTAPPVRIGRAPDNDIVLSDVRASRYHAELHQDGAAWRVVDRGSSNGTFVNGARVVKDRRLASGDRVRFGDTEFIITF